MNTADIARTMKRLKTEQKAATRSRIVETLRVRQEREDARWATMADAILESMKSRPQANVSLRAHHAALAASVEWAQTTKTFRTFAGSAYNGGIMFPQVTVGGVTEELPTVLDLDSLLIPDQYVPILDDHDESGDGEIGRCTMIAVRKSDYTLPIEGIIYAMKPRSQRILKRNDRGRIWQLSVGCQYLMTQSVPDGESVRINNRLQAGPFSIAQNATLTDVSFVEWGGDETTFAKIAARRR